MRIAAMTQRPRAQLGVEKIDAADRGGYLQFSPTESHIDPVALVQLVQNNSRRLPTAGLPSAADYRRMGRYRETI